jgi:hypothetical protein
MRVASSEAPITARERGRIIASREEKSWSGSLV